MKFFIKDFFSKCDQIRKNFIFCAVIVSSYDFQDSRSSHKDIFFNLCMEMQSRVNQ